jgi:hypothetical protein
LDCGALTPPSPVVRRSAGWPAVRDAAVSNGHERSADPGGKRGGGAASEAEGRLTGSTHRSAAHGGLKTAGTRVCTGAPRVGASQSPRASPVSSSRNQLVNSRELASFPCSFAFLQVSSCPRHQELGTKTRVGAFGLLSKPVRKPERSRLTRRELVVSLLHVRERDHATPARPSYSQLH